MTGRTYRDIQFGTAAMDRGLNQTEYIMPGLADAGDRMFGTV